MFTVNSSRWEKRIRNLCLDYFRELDSFIAEIAEISGPEAHIFVASDHGFGPSWFVFRVNSWLQDEGYLRWKELGELDERAEKSVKRLVERHFVLLDWDKTTAYAPTTTSNGIYIRVARSLGDSGVPADQYETFRDRLIEKLKAIRNPIDGQQIIKHVLTKEEAYPGNNNNQAPDLTLVMQDHSFVSVLNKTPVICPRPEIEGTHYPEGVFIANGPGIRQGITVSPFSIIDVAPTLLYSLGLEIPSDFEGCLPTEIFDGPFVENHPPCIGDRTQSPDSYVQRVQNNADKKGEEEIYKRLKMLGYIE
jgi:predicted AlkP superfamily phosphohydrolase/phosphomutase